MLDHLCHREHCYPLGAHRGVLGNHRRALLRGSTDQGRLALGEQRDKLALQLASSPLDDDDDGGVDETEWRRAGWINSAP